MALSGGKLKLKDPKAGRLVERILFDVDTLHEAMKSNIWTPQRGKSLKSLLSSLPKTLESKQGQEKLETVATELAQWVDKLRQEVGYGIHHPADVPEDDFQTTKHQQLRVLEKVLQNTTFDPSCAESSLQEATKRSRFIEQIDAVLQRGIQCADDVNKPVKSLAAAMLGLDELPPDLEPAVNIYMAKSLEFERMEGLNAPPPALDKDLADLRVPQAQSSHQKRKAHFTQGNWQWHVPAHLLEEPDLHERLAKMAFDIAYTAMAAMAHSTNHNITTFAAKNAAGLWNAYGPVKALSTLNQHPHNYTKGVWRRQPLSKPAQAGYDNAGDALRATLPKFAQEGEQKKRPSAPLVTTVKQHVKAHESSAAALLWAVTQMPAAQEKEMDLLWHAGDRAAAKDAAKNGDDIARQAFEARQTKRNHQPVVALRRAVAAVVAAMVKDTPAAAETSKS